MYVRQSALNPSSPSPSSFPYLHSDCGVGEEGYIIDPPFPSQGPPVLLLDHICLGIYAAFPSLSHMNMQGRVAVVQGDRLYYGIREGEIRGNV